MEHGVAAQDQVESGVQTVGDNVVLLKTFMTNSCEINLEEIKENQNQP